MTTLMRAAKNAIVTALLLVALSPATGRGEEAWRESFEQTCSRTSEAMTMSVAELSTLLERCGALQKIVDVQEESVRKVFTKRLQLCKNLYAYVLEYKQHGQAAQ